MKYPSQRKNKIKKAKEENSIITGKRNKKRIKNQIIKKQKLRQLNN